MLSRSTAPDLRALLAKCGIRERLERLVQRAQLVGELQEPFRVIEPPVQRLELGAEGVEPLEHCVELAVVEALAFRHGSIVRRARRPTARCAPL